MTTPPAEMHPSAHRRLPDDSATPKESLRANNEARVGQSADFYSSPSEEGSNFVSAQAGLADSSNVGVADFRLGRAAEKQVEGVKTGKGLLPSSPMDAGTSNHDLGRSELAGKTVDSKEILDTKSSIGSISEEK